ncbi:MAG: TIGR01777 family oxidoreductase [Acidobacteriota bacterium]
MKILITGSSGLIGSALIPLLKSEGHRIVRLVRHKSAPGEDVAVWDPETGKLETSSLAQTDAVINLAGENLAGSRWTNEHKKRIRESRIRGTQLLCESLAQLAVPPRVLVSASAVGFYGSRGDEVLIEDSPPGSDFLAGVCKEWEAAAEPARQKGIRVVNLRIGMVLSGKGGALTAMLPAFRAGAGGKIGDGRQFVSWIAIDDLVGAISHAITTQSLSGPVNATSPNPVRNEEFAKALAKVLSRPAVVPVPAFAVRMLFGEMADALLLASQRVQPTRLEASGFNFQFPEIEAALQHLLKGK